MRSCVKCSWILIQSAVEEDENNTYIGCTFQSHKEADEKQRGNNEYLHKIVKANGLGCEQAKLEEKVGTLNVDVLEV